MQMFTTSGIRSGKTFSTYPTSTPSLATSTQCKHSSRYGGTTPSLTTTPHSPKSSTPPRAMLNSYSPDLYCRCHQGGRTAIPELSSGRAPHMGDTGAPCSPGCVHTTSRDAAQPHPNPRCGRSGESVSVLPRTFGNNNFIPADNHNSTDNQREQKDKNYGWRYPYDPGRQSHR